MSEVVERALVREQDMLYEDIVVTKDGKYLGFLSIAQVLSDQATEHYPAAAPAGRKRNST